MRSAASVAARLAWARRFPKVQLHFHIDGAIRTSTLFEIATAKGRRLPEGVTSARDLERFVSVPEEGCESLVEFLSCFDHILPIVQGDGDAIERVSYECCEDEAAAGIVYFEARFSPHLLETDALPASAVVERVLAGLERGGRDFGVDSRAILCCMRHRPDWSQAVVDLAARFRDRGVVAIDLAGDEGQPTDPHVSAFDDAHRRGIRITAHAGEACGAASVAESLDRLHAERIGHGYRCVEDDAVYERVRREGVHLEVCPTSSIQTSAVASLAAHPAQRFARDGVRFGINTDGPSVGGVSMADEFVVAADGLGLDEAALRKATFDAAHAAFLDEAGRAALLERLEREWPRQ